MVGHQVWHGTFGAGQVTACEGDRVDVDFGTAAARRMIDRFLVPAPSAPHAACVDTARPQAEQPVPEVEKV